MAEHSLSDLLTLINQQVEMGEQLEECLCKAEALAETALIDDFCLLPKQKIQFYFWLLQDVLQRAISIGVAPIKPDHLAA